MRLLIDGDGSPVKEEVIRLASRYSLEVVLITSIAHYTTKEYPSFVTLVYVEKGADRADYELVKVVQSGDWVITQDYGLASLLLPKNCRVFHHSGKEYVKETIDLLLMQRFESAQLRKAKKRTRGPKPFTQADREYFFEELDKKLSNQFKDK